MSQPLPQTPVSPGKGFGERNGKEGWTIRTSGEQASTSYDRGQMTPESQRSPSSVKRKPIPVLDHPRVRLQDAPSSPVSISPPKPGLREPDVASIKNAVSETNADSRASSRNGNVPGTPRIADSITSLPIRGSPTSSYKRAADDASSHSRASSASCHVAQEGGGGGGRGGVLLPEPAEPSDSAVETETLHYHAFEDPTKKKSPNRTSLATLQSNGSSSSGDKRLSQPLAAQQLGVPRQLQRPTSMYTLASEMRGRTLSPLSANGTDHASSRSTSARRSPVPRPTSYIDLLNNVPYNQQVAPGPPLNNQSLQTVVGKGASLLDTKKTLEMYRANVKKTNDAAVQYEFAIYMVNTAKDVLPDDDINPVQLVTEAKQILQKLADRAYPFAQYYLGDGYFSGLFNKDKPDYDKAFTLFAAASKHGHAEAGYRAALCYEFGWGTAKSYPKAAQFYRSSASKNHPGAATRLGIACMRGEMRLKDRYKEGVRWLRRAQESADFQYNAAPFELGMLHLTGFGDDIFKDEVYASQLFTQSAELGHVQANFIMGQAYENGIYGCPRDAALSVHFYNGAATRNHPEAMMALCAWYMVGAEPVLEKDETEACAWAKQAAELGLAKAEYAVGYFTEMGIGCRRDVLEANVWYVRAAGHGNTTAKQRLEVIRAATTAEPGTPKPKTTMKDPEMIPSKDGKKKFMGIF